jgi:hypothetical protein
MTGIAGHQARSRAACAAVDPETFYGPADSPVGGGPYDWERRALAVCAGCPVRAACLAEALTWSARDQHGVIGGMTAGQRRDVLAESDIAPTRSYITLRPRRRRAEVA